MTRRGARGPRTDGLYRGDEAAASRHTWQKGSPARMTQDELPVEVGQLIAEHITSVEQLEILLLLREEPDGDWSPKRVSDEIRTSERSALERLTTLEASGLVTSRANHGGRVFRFSPSSEALRLTVEKLAAAYSERRYTVIDLIFSKPIDKLRVYADAFRFRKDSSNG